MKKQTIILLALLILASPSFAFEPIVVNGSGSQLSNSVFLDAGFYKVISKYDGQRNFIVRLLNKDGKSIAIVANCIDSCKVSDGVKISVGGKYYFNVMSKGYWSIAITEP